MQYLFDLNPGYQFKFMIPSLIVFGAMIAAAILIGWRLKGEKWLKIKRSLINLLFSAGIVGLILVFFRNQGIGFFSARFWWIILFLVVLVWVGRIFWLGFKILPKEFKLQKEKEEFERYLPKGKSINRRR